MPDPITWYALGRTVDDTETILQAVDAKLLLHNLDPSAHGQENEVVYEHRVAPLIDHLSYSIYNIKQNPSARVFTAIVAPALVGDFVTLQAAIDWANLYGGGTIFVKPGTYPQITNLIVYDNIHLLGEDDDKCIIDFALTDSQVLVLGSGVTYKKNVVIENLQFKRLRTAEYDHAAIHADGVSKFIVRNCLFKDNWNSAVSEGTDILLRAAVLENQDVTLEENRFENSGEAIESWTVDNLKIRGNLFQGCKGAAVSPQACANARITENEFLSCEDNCLFSTEDVYLILFANNNIYDQKAPAINFGTLSDSVISGNVFEGAVGSGDCIYGGSGWNRTAITGNMIKSFTGDGVDMNAGDLVSIVGNVIANNGDFGVRLRAGTTYCTVVGNVLRLNTSGTVSDLGTDNVVASNSG